MSTAAPLQTLAAKPKALSTSTQAGLLLQRKCACGSPTASLTGECAECKSKKRLQNKLSIGASNDPLEQEAGRVADQVLAAPANSAGRSAKPHIQRFTGQPTAQASMTVPASVDRVLASPGRSLDAAVRQDMEQRFGHEFSRVRVHSDVAAEQSVRAVDAHAYTVGNHLVFGASRYAPDTAAGRRLLAHELTHVVQQGATLRRASLSPPLEGEGHRGDEDDAKQAVQRLQRVPAIVGLDEAGPKADLTGKRENEMYQLAERDKKLAECKKTAGPDPALCDPATPPGWGDFTGTPVAGGAFRAETFSFIKSVDVPSQECEQSIAGYASGPLKRFQGVFTPSKSWVKPISRDAADPAKNGSAAQVTKCATFFNGLAANQTGFWALSTAAPTGCAASARARGDRATKKADCATVVAKDFTDTAIAESARLLRHEQTHLALTCAIAKKGNDLLTVGTGFDKIDAVIHTKLSTAQSQYDTQSQHGCVAAQQATWESAIAAGLPAINLT